MNIHLAQTFLPNDGRGGLVTGHDFSCAEDVSENGLGFNPFCICHQPIAL
jgi:hypothetical protein